MDSTFPFLALPREIRDAVYDQYVTVDGGLVFNFESEKLETSDDQPIDQAFMLTCKQVAEEMTGLAFQKNTMHFYTAYSDEMRVKAAQFHFPRCGFVAWRGTPSNPWRTGALDRVAVARPEQHARGLIPFCQQYPHLRIEQRLDMLRSLFPTPSTGDDESHFSFERHFMKRGVPCQLASVDATDRLAEWAYAHVPIL
ncbi:Uu.00g099720.m01.CDS01 [Anthostomella pinea]|uniref:Uu.00g099720.m01.CDS01 n=1 Tax=Anthostomella pinea TaxID=933095 RepID=A0AAI8YFD7_9PEZI|nr:Uu.00g099720.m01.CDS01 [Anthostomella pinea]